MGKGFDGVLHQASIGQSAHGYIYGATPRHNDGTWITTAEIIKVSDTLAVGDYIVCADGKKYILVRTANMGNQSPGHALD